MDELSKVKGNDEYKELISKITVISQNLGKAIKGGFYYWR